MANIVIGRWILGSKLDLRPKVGSDKVVLGPKVGSDRKHNGFHGPRVGFGPRSNFLSPRDSCQNLYIDMCVCG